MASVKQRTQKEIMEYIRTHSDDGKLTQSLLDIAEKIGYSNATVHRALRELEEKGLVEIKASDKPTEPNTILFKGNINEIDQLMSRGVKLTQDINQIADNLEDYINDVNWLIRKLDDEAKGAIRNDQIVSVNDIPGTNFQQIVMKKSEVDDSQA